MSDRRILFVVEGKRTEPRFLKRMHEILLETKTENIYSYGTAVYDLLERMIPNGQWDDDLDVVSVLREKEGDGDQRAVLKNEFSDVYLIFDMDPHHQKYDHGILAQATHFFDDSTQNGKLYLNYPMFESVRHLKKHDDTDYLIRTVNTDRKTLRDYK